MCGFPFVSNPLICRFTGLPNSLAGHGEMMLSVDKIAQVPQHSPIWDKTHFHIPEI